MIQEHQPTPVWQFQITTITNFSALQRTERPSWVLGQGVGSPLTSLKGTKLWKI